MERVKSLYVSTPQGYAGVLAKESQHTFTYDKETFDPLKGERAISLTMPPRAESWKTTPMLPAFQTFLPEGYLRDHINEKFGKALRMDDMAYLALSGEDAIGRIRLARDKEALEKSANPTKGESLAEILADQGTRELFEYLCERYLTATSIAGVQPKVVVPVKAEQEGRKQSVGEKSTLRGRQLIVKTDGGGYPDLAENEYHCLSIASRLKGGLVRVPEFNLSDDRRRLAIARFDIAEDGNYLGFEDMVALQATVNERKYEGTYESIATTIRDYSSEALIAASLEAYFVSIVLLVALRNGDAHLKNFGLLYTHPETDDCRLSPLFDLVCTVQYIEKDVMALSLNKSKTWPTRPELENFGRISCDVSRPGPIIDAVIEAVTSYSPDLKGPQWNKFKTIIDAAAGALAKPKVFQMRGDEPIAKGHDRSRGG